LSEILRNPKKSRLKILRNWEKIHLLTMPVTVASVESSFSKMKIVKNRLRTTMSDERLYSLLSCTLETLILNEMQNTEILEKWLNNKTGRRI
jgi:hypothetical protein